MQKIVAILIGTLLPSMAYAQKHLSDYGFDCTLIGFTVPGCGMAPIDLMTTATAKITETAGLIAVPLATIVLLYGALRMVISRGDEGKEAGKKAMMYGALGIILLMLSAAIVGLVKHYSYLLP